MRWDVDPSLLSKSNDLSRLALGTLYLIDNCNYVSLRTGRHGHFLLGGMVYCNLEGTIVKNTLLVLLKLNPTFFGQGGEGREQTRLSCVAEWNFLNFLDTYGKSS